MKTLNFELVEEDNIKVNKHTYFYDYGDGSVEGMIQEIMETPQFPTLSELVIGDWGEAWDDGCQPIIDGIVANADKFSHINKLFIGNMDYEACEVSWIIQGNYSEIWSAMPQLKELTVKGSMNLQLGDDICHENLEALTIICGGLPKDVIKSIQKAKFPKLKKLLLFIGVDDYGFDGDADTIKELLEQADFPELTYLGITNSEIQDELTEVVLNSKFMGQISVLDLSNGTISDKGGALILEKISDYPNINKLDLHHNYFTDEMVERLEALPIKVDVSDQDEADIDEDDGEIYMYAILTE